MTIFYPDISGYDAGISLAGMVAVVVKATEGTTYTNPDFDRVRQDASSRGLPWAGYHFLHHNSSPAAQAQHFHAVAGNAPCMLDVETATDGTKAIVPDALNFASALAGMGGRVVLVYLPHWYWQSIGSPDLRPLAAAGMGLVSSNYPTGGYSDTGPGWAPYGGVTPVVWQYTDAHPLNGFKVDMNAFRGTVDDFRRLLDGGNVALTPQDIQAIWSYVVGGPKHRQDIATYITDMADQVVRGGSSYDGAAYGPIHDTYVAVQKVQSAQGAPQPVSVDAAAVAAALIANPAFAALLPQPPTADQVAELVAEKLAARLQS